jgi:hypothetical protein
MARKIKLVSGHLSGMFLRLTGMAIAFLFSVFVYASGQIITAAGKSGATAKRQSIVPDYAFVAAVPQFSVKGIVESSYDSSVISNVKVTLKDTVTKQVVDSTVTGADGTFFMTVTKPSQVLYALLHVYPTFQFFSKDTLLSIPANDTVNVKLFLNSNVPVYGCPPASAISGMAHLSAYACRLGGVIEMHYSLSAHEQTRLSLFGANGRLVKELFDRHEQAGEHQARMETAGLSTGIYYLLLQAGKQVAITKIAIID